MQNETTPRHGLSREAARELCERVLGFSGAENARVNVFAGARSFTRTANNRVTSSGAADDTTVRITSVFGKRVASVDTNRLDDGSLERAVRESEALARISPEDPEYMPELGAGEYADVDGYYSSTGELAAESRARAASLAIDAAGRAGTTAAGFIDVSAGSEAAATSNGLFGYYPRTGVSSTLTVRTADGLSSGWAGDEAADWDTIESGRIASDAVRKCLGWRGKTSLDPGRYDVILEPTAVGNLMVNLMGSFGARQADEGRSFFSRPGGGNRIGETLFDERVTIVSDPSEPNAQTAPFTPAGLPVTREVWVENGVLRTLAYSRFWADRNDVGPRPGPANFIMSGGVETLDELIAGTPRGVLITRFWYIRSLNPQTLAFTGLTRDGTFLIENGRIARPVHNFRFNQPLAELLANVDQLGAPTRVPAGEGSYGPPVIVPALKVRDFNLSSVSDAV